MKNNGEIPEFKEDCFAFSENSYITRANGEKIIKIVDCKVLKRDRCNNCSFYKHKSLHDSVKIENDVSNYGSGKKIKEGEEY